MKLGLYLVGLMSGLAFGMLFAPKKGKELRKQMAGAVKKGEGDNMEAFGVLAGAVKEAGVEAWGEMKSLELSPEKIQRFMSNAEETGYDMAAKLESRVDKATEVAKRKITPLRSALKKARTTLKKKF